MTSGAALTTSFDETIRSFAALCPARPRNMSMPPAMPISSETQPMPLIIGSSHSSKYTFGLVRSPVDAATRLSRSS